MRASPSSLILKASENCTYIVVPINQVKYQRHDISACTMYRWRPPVTPLTPQISACTMYRWRPPITSLSPHWHYFPTNFDTNLATTMSWSARLGRFNLQLLHYKIEVSSQISTQVRQVWGRTSRVKDNNNVINIINRAIYIAPYSYEASNPFTIARNVSKTALDSVSRYTRAQRKMS